MDARTSLANAQTEETEQRTDANIDKQMGQIMDTLGKGQKTGILTPSGTQIAAENLGVSDYLGVNPPDPSLMEKVYKMLGVDKEQTPHIDTPATPKAAPKKSKKSTKPSGQKIRVRRLSDGQTGTINAEDFDPKKYQDLSKEEGEKILSPDLAREYLKKAGGSKVLARKLAKADGFSF